VQLKPLQGDDALRILDLARINFVQRIVDLDQ
jgi:hypothetical protein